MTELGVRATVKGRKSRDPYFVAHGHKSSPVPPGKSMHGASSQGFARYRSKRRVRQRLPGWKRAVPAVPSVQWRSRWWRTSVPPSIDLADTSSGKFWEHIVGRVRGGAGQDAATVTYQGRVEGGQQHEADGACDD